MGELWYGCGTIQHMRSEGHHRRAPETMPSTTSGVIVLAEGASISTSTAVYPRSANMPAHADQLLWPDQLQRLSPRSNSGTHSPLTPPASACASPSPVARSKTSGVGHSRGATSLAGRTRNFVHRAAAAAPDEEGRESVEAVKRPKAERAAGRRERVWVAKGPDMVGRGDEKASRTRRCPRRVYNAG